VLQSLRLEEFVILAEADIAFDAGLNVITGETGTGKSILIDAIGFLAGGRAEAGWVREGAAGLAVEGVFDLTALPGALAFAGNLGVEVVRGKLRLRRELGANGRGKGWIGGQAVRIADLRGICEHLIAIHGQGEHRRLLDPGVQVLLLDRFADILHLRDAYAGARERWLSSIRETAAARARLLDLAEKEEWHRYQRDEIAGARIMPAEEDRLRERLAGLTARRLAVDTRAEIERILFEEDGSAADRIETSLHRLTGRDAREDEWGAARAEIERARDALRQARRLMPGSGDDLDLEEDPASIEDRLSQMARLKKKYGGSCESILERKAVLDALIEETESLRATLEGAEATIDQAALVVIQAGVELSRRRAERAPALARAITSELGELGMAGAVLEVVLDREDADGVDDAGVLSIDGQSVRTHSDGIDRGWFRLRPNPGEGAGPIGEIASGGELSRTLLAVLAVLGGREEPRTAIFDEVDAGVGGATATAVARRITGIARDRQVLLVTHLPTVACRATRHFRVEKAERNGRTCATITLLNREERIGELARMLAGEGDSVIARKHARALMESAAGQPRRIDDQSFV
jgi:DNA repair protein RecN (Recombination protein N)